MNLAEHADLFLLHVKESGAATQETRLFARAKVERRTTPGEHIFQTSLGVEEIDSVLRWLAPTAGAVAGDCSRQPLALIGEVAFAGNEDAATLEDGNLTALESLVLGDRREKA